MNNPLNTPLFPITRRRFVKFLTIGTATIGGVAWLSSLEECSYDKSSPTAPPPTTGQKVTLTLANESALQNVGGFIRRSFGSNANGGKEVIIMRLAASGANDFATASVICTHMGCAVNSPSGGKINCPCHGSIYSAQSGNFADRISGPAPSGLPKFATTFDGTTITITF